MNLLTADVMNSIIGASSCKKMADVSMNVYKQAENNGDEETMKRAFGYTADSMDSANEYSQKTQKALEEAQAEANELDKKEQQEQGTIQPEPDNLPPTDTVKISSEGKAAAQIQDTVNQDTVSQSSTDIPVPSGSAPVTEAKIYTSKGTVKPEAMKTTLSVTG